MCIFRASYVGRDGNASLRKGEVYGIERIVYKENGKTAYILEGVDGEYDEALFHELENKGAHLLVGATIPRVGSCMRLVKRKNDMSEIMTGTVKFVEKSNIPGAYMAYTEKAVYEVSAMK